MGLVNSDDVLCGVFVLEVVEDAEDVVDMAEEVFVIEGVVCSDVLFAAVVVAADELLFDIVVEVLFCSP